jgi:TRAP-type mannitol/chloroaromatic compound transport system substrate-binding protein
MATTKDQERLNRRRFLKGGAVTAAAAAGMVSMPNVSRAQTATLKMQGSWGAKDVFNEMAQDYVERVNKMAGGRLKIDYLVGGAVVHPFQVFDAVHGGHGLLVRQA